MQPTEGGMNGVIPHDHLNHSQLMQLLSILSGLEIDNEQWNGQGFMFEWRSGRWCRAVLLAR